MRRRLLKYWAIFQTQVNNNFAYAGDMAAQSLSIVLFMFVFLHLWQAVYGSTGQQAIAGLTLHETLWYLMLAETIQLSKPRLSQTIAAAVKDGSIAYLLNKPYNFLLYQVSIGLGQSVLKMVFNALAGGAVVWLSVGPPPDPRGWPLVLIAIALGWLIDFCIAALIGLSAFVAEEVSAFEWIYAKLLLLVGGLLIPLDFFPDWLRSIAVATPFAYTLYGPARLFVDPSLARFATLLLGQVAWLAVLGLLVAVAYARGVRWLTINGG